MSQTYIEQMQCVFFIHVYVHHLQQLPYFFEIHLPVFVFVSFLKPVPDPPELVFRETPLQTILQ